MSEPDSATLTAAQFRMAKAALGLSNPDVAKLTGLHTNTLKRADRGAVTRQTWALIRMTLEGQGVQFIEANGGAPGVRYEPESE